MILRGLGQISKVVIHLANFLRHFGNPLASSFHLIKRFSDVLSNFDNLISYSLHLLNIPCNFFQRLHHSVPSGRFFLLIFTIRTFRLFLNYLMKGSLIVLENLILSLKNSIAIVNHVEAYLIYCKINFTFAGCIELLYHFSLVLCRYKRGLFRLMYLIFFVRLSIKGGFSLRVVLLRRRIQHVFLFMLHLRQSVFSKHGRLIWVFYLNSYVHLASNSTITM